ncbi:MAG: CBS domain-containing protein [Phycisphaerales bacterium]|jgi:IMP dehydrogenase|nr:CBS domain-containing protein [Phycisphaerales bacterium]
MGTASSVICSKNACGKSCVETIRPTDSVLEAARLMNERRIGSLVVMHEHKIAGIVTERDILTRVVAMQRDPASTPVSVVMTRDVYAAEPGHTIEDLRAAMRNRRIRHVPIVENGQLVGMVSIGDLNAHVHAELAETITSLEAYIAQG